MITSKFYSLITEEVENVPMMITQEKLFHICKTTCDSLKGGKIPCNSQLSTVSTPYNGKIFLDYDTKIQL